VEVIAFWAATLSPARLLPDRPAWRRPLARLFHSCELFVDVVLLWHNCMIHVQRIDTLELPALAPYRTMRQQVEHRQQGILVAESDKVVRRMLESEFAVVSLLIPEKWLEYFEPLVAKRP